MNQPQPLSGPPPHPPPAGPPSTDTMVQPSTIFVVDDDPLSLDALGRLLEIETIHHVERYRAPIDALEALREEPADLVIADLNMPSVDGIAFLRQARKLNPDGARILISGYGDKESVIKAVNSAGIYQFIEKPWDNTQLLTAVGNALEHVALARKVRETLSALRVRNEELERTIAELRDAQDRLVAAERLAAVGRLASGVAHELGNQLSLFGYAELLAERYKDDPEARDLTDPLLAARRRLSVLVASIKDFVSGAGKIVHTRSVAPLAPIVDEAVSILRFEPALKSRKLVCEPDDRDLRAYINRDKILQVVLNLVRNAIHATADGGRVRVGLARVGDRAILEVEDDGHGIAPEHLERIWEPFFSTKGEKGTGLGLGICRRILEEHDGTIRVVSAPGQGARFIVDLPVSQGAGESG